MVRPFYDKAIPLIHSGLVVLVLTSIGLVLIIKPYAGIG